MISQAQGQAESAIFNFNFLKLILTPKKLTSKTQVKRLKTRVAMEINGEETAQEGGRDKPPAIPETADSSSSSSNSAVGGGSRSSSSCELTAEFKKAAGSSSYSHAMALFFLFIATTHPTVLTSMLSEPAARTARMVEKGVAIFFFFWLTWLEMTCVLHVCATCNNRTNFYIHDSIWGYR